MTGPFLKNLFEEIAINSLADATVAKRVAEDYAAFFGMTKNRQAEIALVASELAHNHIQHQTSHGLIRLSGTEIGGTNCLSIASLDNGPGIIDVNRALYGKSSCNGLGAGLKTVAGLSDRFAICSGTSGKALCSGIQGCDYATIIVSTVWADRNSHSKLFDSELDVSVLNKPCGGVSGDGVMIQHDSPYIRITMVDSAGHGSPAAMITEQVWVELEKLALFWPVDHVIRELENKMVDTRGLAVHCLRLNRLDSTLQSAGVGNVRARLYLDGKCIIPPVQGGVVGHLKWQTIHRHDYGPFDEILAFMHTDGHQPLPEFELNSFFQKNNVCGPDRMHGSPPRGISAAVWAQLLFDPGHIQPDDTALLVWQWPGK